ncbi:hypothetical protein ACQW02_24785 [Humitalea sp. 24SJ18S-53]|uniref:hypothetical protein n=1 Tax=Humitalea sp. 24SJ18S-53 TaxID=3422307 RepID=UPI003D6694E1
MVTDLAPGVETLIDGRLYVLRQPCVLDGRMSSYPADARGYTAVNCYLLVEGGSALMLDTGFSAHAGQVVAQLRSVLAPGTRLSVYPMRLNEFMSVCNVEVIADNFDVEQCYSSNPDASLWVDFGGRSDAGGVMPAPLKTTLVARVQTLNVGPGTGRPVEAFQAPIRLIGTRWLYDHATRTLFTSDSFTHEWATDAAGPWTLDRADDAQGPAHLRSFLLNTRYWWLEGGETTSLRRKLRDVFDRHDIETLAPGYGRVFRGRDTVRRQFDMMDDVLADLSRDRIAPHYVFRDELR